MEQTPAVPARKRTGLLIVIAVVVVVVLVGGGFAATQIVAGQHAAATATAEYTFNYGPCGAVLVSDAVSNLDTVNSHFQDVYTLASATGRGALAPVVSNMQTVKQNAEDIEVPSCLAGAKAGLVGGIDGAINGFLAFMAQKNDAFVDSIFRKAVTDLDTYTSEVARVLACAPDC